MKWKVYSGDKYYQLEAFSILQKDLNSWFPLHDNASEYVAGVKTYLAKHNVMALEHPPYSQTCHRLTYSFFHDYMVF
jgi:hypothetical protein